MIRIFDPKDKMGRFWRLNEGTYIIGRSADCDLHINDDTISRKHARLEISAEDLATIFDLGSHNGIVINGILIKDSAKLNHNDSIELGQVVLKFVSSENSDGIKDSISLKEDNGLSSVTMFPMEKALKSFPPNVLENPKIFNSFFEFGKMLIKPGEDDEVLNNSLVLLKDVIPVDRAAIFNLAEGKENITISAQYTANKSGHGSFSISRTILNELFNRKEAVLVSDARDDVKYAEQHSIISSGIKSAMAVPLYDEGEVFGVLYADTSDIANHYNENHLRVMATFGNMLAAKITNNMLLNERREKEIMESELAVASQIQERLLPESIPGIQGYGINAFQIQCKQVGGDLYDISKLDDGRILFILADVSGKGIGAALLASNILAAFRALYNSKNFNILDATRAVSEQLLSFSRARDFATLFIGLLDPDTATLNYVNAGHNPPLVIREKGNPEYLEASGIPIGMMNLNTWQEESMELNPGDSVLIFSDGIPEAMDGQGDQFSDERLEQFILDNRGMVPDELLKLIMVEIENFIGDNPRSDDITLIALRRNSE